jgi:hypothetical protein
MEILEKSFQA